MQNSGVIRDLYAVHSGHYSGTPHRYTGVRFIRKAKTSLWAKVQKSDGTTVDVWIKKVPGNGRRYKNQELALVEANTCLIGRKVRFTAQKKGKPHFFEELV
jgi:hypothetical protein